jgi:hypothetical protein
MAFMNARFRLAGGGLPTTNYHIIVIFSVVSHAVAAPPAALFPVLQLFGNPIFRFALAESLNANSFKEKTLQSNSC